MELKFGIEMTDDCKYVVIANWTDQVDGWVYVTKPFDTYKEVEEWVHKIKDDFAVAKFMV